MFYTDSGNAILQQETETTHVSKLQLLLCSQPFGLGLPVELPTSDVEHSADVRASVRVFAFVSGVLNNGVKFFNIIRRNIVIFIF